MKQQFDSMKEKIMDKKYLAEIKTREQLATPGPWEASRDRSVGGETHVCCCANDADTDFITHVRTDIPVLIFEVERLTEENATLKKALGVMATDIIKCFHDMKECGIIKIIKDSDTHNMVESYVKYADQLMHRKAAK